MKTHIASEQNQNDRRHMAPYLTRAAAKLVAERNDVRFLLANVPSHDELYSEEGTPATLELHGSTVEIERRWCDSLSERLRLLDDAVRRVDDGSFGTCIECESPIAEARIEADPVTRRCFTCQLAAERDARTPSL